MRKAVRGTEDAPDSGMPVWTYACLIAGLVLAGVGAVTRSSSWIIAGLGIASMFVPAWVLLNPARARSLVGLPARHTWPYSDRGRRFLAAACWAVVGVIFLLLGAWPALVELIW